MTEIITTNTCDTCKREVIESAQTCPYCGSSDFSKHVEIFEKETVFIKERIKIRGKDCNLPSKKNPVYKYQQGFDTSQLTSSGYAHKTMIVDCQQDKYKEVVTDEDGKIIHYCEESLIEHQGHGSAKFTK